ncbi:hypothetical protein Q31b_34320 [Novipirellula aureliae]|uniref:Uncharacterized protein n=1 Tax=Novipirellula aureliae TaxID=2527966 RepID=A0A5C6DTJ5_9BACT|nr:hypothetical protein Q31b_34320 [Novipirellula aureliae]
MCDNEVGGQRTTGYQDSAPRYGQRRIQTPGNPGIALELATDTKNVTTTCHLSVSSDSQVRNQKILSGLADHRVSRATQT